MVKLISSSKNLYLVVGVVVHHCNLSKVEIERILV
jgi:hypothetical protein